jgi:toxin-antitoxin system PIN domain toxin
MSGRAAARRPYLLDTNVLIALAWPNHVHHGEAVSWFARKGSARFRTCPITQTGFVRISSNPNVSAAAVSPHAAIALLARFIALPGHEFWPDDLSAAEAFAEPGRVVGHRQVTDAYLVALAVRHGGALATLDRAVTAIAAGRREAVEILFDRL